MIERPSDQYRTAITDPDDFVGRAALLEQFRRSPRLFRVLLGGRRIGKTSLLRAVEWRLLQPDLAQPRRAFPVYVDLQRAEPRSLPHFRFLLIARLRQAITRWEQSNLPSAQDAVGAYRTFLRHVAEVKVGVDFLAKIEVKLTPNAAGQADELSDDGFVRALVSTFEDLQQWRFEGVCFLIDEAEYIIRSNWADHAWSYFRSLKDSETAVKSLLGIVLSGYRDLKEYRQQVGSPLNIAHVEWLSPLRADESRTLALRRSQLERVSLDDRDFEHLSAWAGEHPFLVQQTLNALFDGRLVRSSTVTDDVIGALSRHLRPHFSHWWNHDGRSDGFGDDERRVYHALIEHPEAAITTLARAAALPDGRVLEAVDVLVGTGVASRPDDDHVMLGARLFERWVRQNRSS
jgi:hypothetical protein